MWRPVAVMCALAGCSQAPSRPPEPANAIGSQSAPDPHKVLSARWARMFADPAAVVVAANEFGYDAGNWARSDGGGYRTQGTEQVLPKGFDRPIVRTGFRAVGKAAGRVDAVIFTFAVDRRGALDTRKGRDAANIPRRIVAGFLSRFEVSPDDRVRRAVQTGVSATMSRDGGRIVVVGTPSPGGYRSEVTITRS